MKHLSSLIIKEAGFVKQALAIRIGKAILEPYTTQQGRVILMEKAFG